MRLLLRCLSILALLISTALGQSDFIKIATYNLLRFPEAEGVARVEHFQTVLTAMRPDILVVQEMQSQQGVDLFVNQIINNPGMSGYKAAPFVDGYDSDNALFYNTRKIEFVRNRQILTWLREVSEYTLKYKGSQSLPSIKIYSLHLKAGNTPGDASRRYKDAQVLRGELNKLAAGSYFVVAGDFNLYRSSESAYQEFVGSRDNNNGQCFDPIDKPGEWHNNSLFARWHTQSTRTTQFGDGSTGGMDDRFDLILLSSAFFDSTDFLYTKDSYQSFGNDGLHFNSAINAGFNRAVPPEVANALYNASDHLPVTLTVGAMITTGVSRRTGNANPSVFQLSPNYPNPFNGSTSIMITPGVDGYIDIAVYNVLGKVVFSKKLVANKGFGFRFSWDGKNNFGMPVQTGIYTLTATNGSMRKRIKMLYLK